MADDKKKIIEEFNKDVESLQDKLNNVITTLGNKLDAGLRNKMQGLKDSANEFIGSFEKGEDITKKLSSKLTKLASDINKQSAERLSLETQLAQAAIDRNKTLQKNLLNQLLVNKLTTQQLETTQTLLIKLQQIAEAEEKAKKEKKQQEILEKSLYAQAKKRYELFKTSLSGLFTYLISAFKVVNQGNVDMAKSMGVMEDSAKNYSRSFQNYVLNSKDGYLSLQKMQKAQIELTQQLGFAARFSEEELDTFSRLTGIVGLTADEAGNIAKFSAAAGMESKDYVAELRKSAFYAQQANKIHISDKELLSTIGKLSAGILVKFQGNPKALAEAVIQAKKLGLNLEQIDKIGDSMLEWESSIENELKAELITGKQLNLERARYAALTGDTATLMQEVANQAGSLADFQNMNIIAQKSLAQAFGMSREEMSEMLMKQEAINKYGDAASQLNKEQLEYMQKHNLSASEMVDKINNQRSVQEKFNDAMERLQGIVGQLIGDSGFGKLAELIGNILGSTAGLVTVMSFYIAKQVFSLTLAILEYQARKRAAKMNALDASFEMTKSAAAAPGIGFLIAGGVALASAALLLGMLSKGDDVISPGYGKRMLFDKGSITAFNDEDTIVAGTNLGGGRKSAGGGEDNSSLIAAIKDLHATVKDTSNRPAVAYINGKDAFAREVGASYALGTSQNINTSYKLA